MTDLKTRENVTNTVKRKRRLTKKQEALMYKNKGYNKHHIVPKSKGGKKNRDNIVWLKINSHKQYHDFFGNKRPEEVIEHIVNVFFNGNWGYVFEAVAKEKANARKNRF